MLLDTPLCNFGRKAPDFKLNSFDKSSYSLGQLVGTNGLLVAFICNHCPYVKAIITNLVADAQELQTVGIQTVAIMPNDYISYPADSPEKMGEFAKQHNFNFPYLVDDTQSVAKAYGAVCTPDFFGFNANLELQYRGRLDNLTMGKDGTQQKIITWGQRIFYPVQAREYGGNALRGMSGKPLSTSGHRAKTGVQIAENHRGPRSSNF